MCGITGFWQHPGASDQALTQWGNAMNTALRHRGPDDGGLWVDGGVGIGLANRRLAIVDLSPAGHQPMISHSGRYVIAYNGEIYNFLDIRQDLEQAGQQFVSHSDTEVLLEACALWGVERAVKHLNGMFSFALWDRQECTLTLVRDRLGVKPLFYGWSHGTFLFGSELKALCAHPDFSRTLDHSSVTLFLRLGYIPAPYCIYEHIYKLPPGHMLTVSAPQQHPSPEAYWSAKTIVESGRSSRVREDIHAAADHVEALVRDAVRLRMLADVPVGAFLSGGIDSSMIVAMMQAQTSSTVKTFTIGFSEASYNEADHARQIADYLGTDHTELYISPEEACDLIPQLPSIYDEPLADPSQIPTFFVSQLARQLVTVSLSGDGGDELFGGYEEYLRGLRRWRVLRHLTPVARQLIGQGLSVFTRPVSTAVLSLAPTGTGTSLLAKERWRKIEQVLKATTPEMLHQYHVSQWMSPVDLMPGASEPPTAFTDPHLWADGLDDVERMMFMDLVTYLPEDILAKVDRASMAVSLEARVPLLDYRLVEFAWRLPVAFKVHRGQSKRILRLILSRYVPSHLFERPKMGFNVPLGAWLRGPLRAWAEALLAPAALQEHGLFNPILIRRTWMEHLSETQDRANQLWGILMFQAWHQRWM
jgi:asparagine synthase (glutamine-hydrolysing)